MCMLSTKLEQCLSTCSLEPDSNGNLYEEGLLDSVFRNKSCMEMKKAGLGKMELRPQLNSQARMGSSTHRLEWE